MQYQITSQRQHSDDDDDDTHENSTIQLKRKLVGHYLQSYLISRPETDVVDIIKFLSLFLFMIRLSVCETAISSLLEDLRYECEDLLLNAT